MAASNTDKLRKGYQAFSTTLASTKALGASSMSLSSATGIPTTTGVDFTVGRVDSSGASTPTTKVVYTGTLSGTTVSNLTVKEGSDQSHAAGTVVEITFTASMWNDHIDQHLVEHNQDGTHGAITSTSVTSTGQVQGTNLKLTTGNILDTNGNEEIKTVATSSAVNEITVTNAATGNAPQISATGDDTNIALSLKGKGTGGTLLELRTQTDVSNSITNATTAGLKIQTGWGQINTTATANVNETVTFPTAFSATPLSVVISINGFAASAQADLSSFTTGITKTLMIAEIPSATGFRARISNGDGTNLSAGYYAYSWIAIGPA